MPTYTTTYTISVRKNDINLPYLASQSAIIEAAKTGSDGILTLYTYPGIQITNDFHAQEIKVSGTITFGTPEAGSLADVVSNGYLVVIGYTRDGRTIEHSSTALSNSDISCGTGQTYTLSEKTLLATKTVNDETFGFDDYKSFGVYFGWTPSQDRITHDGQVIQQFISAVNLTINLAGDKKKWIIEPTMPLKWRGHYIAPLTTAEQVIVNVDSEQHVTTLADVLSDDQEEIGYAQEAGRIRNANVGDRNQPVYFSEGRPVAWSGTSALGDSTSFVFINSNGSFAVTNATVGSTKKPVYLNGGTITALSGNEGSAYQPVYLRNGAITAGAYTFVVLEPGEELPNNPDAHTFYFMPKT